MNVLGVLVVCWLGVASARDSSSTTCRCKGGSSKGGECGKHGEAYEWCYLEGNFGECGHEGKNWKKCTTPEAKCGLGYGIGSVVTAGLCRKPITSNSDCKKFTQQIGVSFDRDTSNHWGDRSVMPKGCILPNAHSTYLHFKMGSGSHCGADGWVCLCEDGCTKCPHGTYNDDALGVSRCKLCDDLRPTTDVTGATSQASCKTCKPGQKFKNNACIDCPEDTYGSGSRYCTRCPPGQSTHGKTGQESKDSCSVCNPGEGFWNRRGQTKKCLPCPENFYSTKGLCKRCPPEKPSTHGKRGAKSAAECSEIGTCQPGHGNTPLKRGYCAAIIGDAKRCVSDECKSKVGRECEEMGKKLGLSQTWGGFRATGHGDPAGCFTFYNSLYVFQTNNGAHDAESMEPAMNSNKMSICKKGCFECPANTFSNGGDDAICRPCPSSPNGNTKYSTNGKTKQSECVPSCVAGYGVNEKGGECVTCPVNHYSTGGLDADCQKCPNDAPFTRGVTGASHISMCEACESASDFRYLNEHEGLVRADGKPQCKSSCDGGFEKDPGQNTCKRCNAGEYSEKDGHQCQKCAADYTSAPGSAQCQPSDTLEKTLALLKTRLDKEKEINNEQVYRTARLHATQTIRQKYKELMERRAKTDGEIETNYCKEEREAGTVVFPAIEVSEEIENIDDTTCIDTNRDELLKAFCNVFRPKLDTLLISQGITKKARAFFPNICCKERRGPNLENCTDPNNKIPREKIIPFALSQGGPYSRQNLYAEVNEALKWDGYLHQGMRDVLAELPRASALGERINVFFQEISMCGPRILQEPGVDGEISLCQLFVPYTHVLAQFHTELAAFYQQPSFLEVAGDRLGKVRSAMRERQVSVEPMGQFSDTLKTKKQKTDEIVTWCKEPPRAHFSPGELRELKTMFCKGNGSHIDVHGSRVKNIAVHYLEKDIAFTDQNMFNRIDSLRYDVEDKFCTSKLFDADDISIQQVAMNTDGTTKEWVAVVKLNTGKHGYLKSEVPKCMRAPYIPRAEVTVKVYEDRDGLCCAGSNDFAQCREGCTTVTRVDNKSGKHFTKKVIVDGVRYDVKDSFGRRRRRLLQRGGGGCS
jgi:hypothetical protein